MNRLAFAFLALAAACGGDDSGNTSIDAPAGGKQDAPVTTQTDAPSNIPATVTISGIVSQISTSGKKALAGVTITAFQRVGDTMIATTTSGTDGSFTVSAPTNGSPVDAYLVATKSGLLDTYLYPPYVLSKDFANVPVLVLDSQTQSFANQFAGADPQAATNGWIGAIITDSSMNAVAGATLVSTPAGTIRYNSSSGLPGSANQAPSTAADGIAYDMNVAAGNVSLTATASGMTFQTHSVNARAGKITLTLITP